MIGDRRKPLNKRIALMIVFSLTLVFSLPVAKLEGVMVKLSLDELAKQADLIVVGKVESVRSESIKGKIFSFATISVDSKIKGQLQTQQNSLVVKFPGGKVGDVGMNVENSTDYKVGENVVAFLKRTPGQPDYVTVGSSQGKFLIENRIVPRENVSLDEFVDCIEKILGPAK